MLNQKVNFYNCVEDELEEEFWEILISALEITAINTGIHLFFLNLHVFIFPQFIVHLNSEVNYKVGEIMLFPMFG